MFLINVFHWPIPSQYCPWPPHRQWRITALRSTMMKGRLGRMRNSECKNRLRDHYLKINPHLNHTDFTISETQVCAMSLPSSRVFTDTCQGDSGGPGVQFKKGKLKTNSQGLAYPDRAELIGVTSWGLGCGSRLPGVYTRISRYSRYSHMQIYWMFNSSNRWFTG